MNTCSVVILLDNKEMLMTYLMPLRDVSEEIQDWENGGQIFLDYYAMLDRAAETLEV